MQRAAKMSSTTDTTFSSYRPGSHHNPTQLTRAATTLRFLRRNRRGLRPVGTGTGTKRVPARFRPARASRLSPGAKVFVPLACAVASARTPADTSLPAAPAASTAALPATKKTMDGPMYSPNRVTPAPSCTTSAGACHPTKNPATTTTTTTAVVSQATKTTTDPAALPAAPSGTTTDTTTAAPPTEPLLNASRATASTRVTAHYRSQPCLRTPGEPPPPTKPPLTTAAMPPPSAEPPLATASVQPYRATTTCTLST